MPGRLPHARLLRNYDFRRLRRRGAGLAALESLYVAGRSLIGYVQLSLRVTFYGPLRKGEASRVGTGRRSVSAAREEGTSARMAQSQW